MEPIYIGTRIDGLSSSSITGSWVMLKDEKGTYVAPLAPARLFASFEKGFTGFQARLYFDPTKLEADPQGRKDHRFLRSGLKMADAKFAEVDLSQNV